MVHPEEHQGETMEAPSEFERARGNYARGLESYLKAHVEEKSVLEKKSDSINEPLIRFISDVVTGRLERSVTNLSPEEKTEFFESCPSLQNLEVSKSKTDSRDSRDGFLVNVDGFKTMKPELRRPVMQELVRAALLTKALNIYYKPGSVEVLPEEYLALLAQLGTDRADVEDRLRTRGDFFLDSSNVFNGLSKAYEQDPELFIDFITVFAEHHGRGSTLNERWKALVDSGFKYYGIDKILATDEGLPYRLGKRAEDTKLAKARLQLFEGREGKPIKTYADLTKEVVTLTEDIGRLKALLIEERKKGSELERDVGVASQERGSLREELAQENTAREAAEAKAVALERRLQELLAIAEEKVGAFSKDTRAARMRKLVENPPPS